MSERLAIAGSGAIACGLAAVAATPGPRNRIRALRRLLRQRASAKVHALCEKLGADVNGNVTVSRDPDVLLGRDVRRRGDRRGPARQGGRSGARSASTCADDAVLATTTSSLPIGELARGQRPPGALRRPARVQPGAEDGPGRARVPGRRRRERHARARPRAVRGARQDRGRGAGHAGLRRQPPAVPVPVRGRAADGAHRAWTPRRSTPACGSAPATRWGRSRCWTSWGSTSAPRSAQHDRRRGARHASSELIAEGALGRKTGRGFHTY